MFLMHNQKEQLEHLMQGHEGSTNFLNRLIEPIYMYVQVIEKN